MLMSTSREWGLAVYEQVRSYVCSPHVLREEVVTVLFCKGNEHCAVCLR